MISGVEERWEYTWQVLAQLHIQAERVWPPKPSLHLAKEMYAIHDYDKEVNLSDPQHQRYFSLLAAWKHVLHHVAHHPDLEPHNFAIIMEDDISLQEDVSLAAARNAILHGFDLARSDGWLYLAVCPTEYFPETEQYQGLTYSKMVGWCAHALAFTKHRAASIMHEMHTSMKEDFLTQFPSYSFGHGVDQMLSQYGHIHNGTWTVATNLQGKHNAVGLFYQDRERFHSTING